MKTTTVPFSPATSSSAYVLPSVAGSRNSAACVSRTTCVAVAAISHLLVPQIHADDGLPVHSFQSLSVRYPAPPSINTPQHGRASRGLGAAITRLSDDLRCYWRPQRTRTLTQASRS